MFGFRNIFQVAVFLTVLREGASTCEDTWTPFKDGLCIKGFTYLATYEDARAFCSLQGDDILNASLVMVKDSDMQNILETYTDGITGTLWLGARFDNESSQFRWESGELLTYNNWQDDQPGNVTNADICIEMLPTEGRKWIHVTCQKRNLVICQKPRPWTLKDAVKKIVALQQQLENSIVDVENVKNELGDANNEIVGLQHQVEEEQQKLIETIVEMENIRDQLGDAKNEVVKVREDLNDVNSRVVPVGSIYVEYYNQPSPLLLWPNFTWEDVTGAYAGLFFRALGGSSEVWGTTQNGCAPRITDMRYGEHSDQGFPNPNPIPEDGWSPYGRAGYNYYLGPSYYEALSFYTAGCEVRPKNQAVRIWKRAA